MKAALKRAAVAVVAMGYCMGSQAGFMDDFYTAAGAAANVTPAQTVSGQGGRYVTGGSAVWRVPNKTFTPFLFQQPSIKAGCGGIDFFAGSFGFANSSDFVNYLRNIGQNSIGLFFQIALKAMSPLLSDTIKEISEDIQKMNQYLGSSCQMAQMLTKNADNWVTQKVKDSSLQSTVNGAVSGFYDSYKQFKTDLGGAIGTTFPAGQTSNSGGTKLGQQVNVTWALLNSGAFAGGTLEEQIIGMNLIGTTIYKLKAGSTEETDHIHLGRRLWIPDFAGRWNDAPRNLEVFSCNDTTNSCLDAPDFRQNDNIPNFMSLASKAYVSMKLIRDAIMNRQDINSVPGGAQAMLMLGATRLPAFKLLEVTSTPGMAGVSEMLMQKYADLIGLDMAANYVGGMAQDIMKASKAAKMGSSSVSLDDIKDVEQRVRQLQEDVEAHRKIVYENAGTESDLITFVQHLERSIYTSFNLQLMNNLKFASK